MTVRSGETENAWYRSERYIHTSEGWYFITRENTQEGPFRTMQEAENQLTQYIRQASQADPYSD